MNGEVANRTHSPRPAPLRVPREFYLPETGPAPTKVSRPEHVLPIPLDLYLREAGGPHKREDKK